MDIKNFVYGSVILACDKNGVNLYTHFLNNNKLIEPYFLFKRVFGLDDLGGVVSGTGVLPGFEFGTGVLPGFVFGTGVLGTLAIKTHTCFIIYSFSRESPQETSISQSL